MPLGLLPSLETSSPPWVKPQGFCTLNDDHPLCSRDAGMALAVFWDEARGAFLDHGPLGQYEVPPGGSSLPRYTKGRGGLAMEFLGGAKERRYAVRAGQPFIADRTSPFTAVAIVRVAAGTKTFWSCGQQTDSNNAVILGCNSSRQVCIASPASPISSTLVIPVSRWVTCGVTQRTSTDRTFMLDGTTQVSVTSQTAGNIGTTQPHSLGRDYSNSAPNTGDDMLGEIEAVFLWNKAIPINLLANIGYNPYQLVVAQQSRIAFSFGAPPVVGTSSLLWRRRRELVYS